MNEFEDSESSNAALLILKNYVPELTRLIYSTDYKYLKVKLKVFLSIEVSKLLRMGVFDDAKFQVFDVKRLTDSGYQELGIGIILGISNSCIINDMSYGFLKLFGDNDFELIVVDNFQGDVELSSQLDTPKMKRYKKKPLIVEAVQWFPGMDLDYVKECGMNLPESERFGKFWNAVHEIELEVQPGGWIINAGGGDLYPCDAHTFNESFDLVE